IKGSGRSVVGIDLGCAIIAARQAGLLKTGGGHAMAVGFSVEKHRLAELQDFLDTYYPQAVDLPESADLSVDAMLCVSGATVVFAQQMAVMAPFGADNPEPMIVFSYVTVLFHERIGRERQTLRVFLQDENGGRLKALLFRADETPLAKALEETTRPLLHVAGYLRAENWNDRTDVTFFIQDVAYA
ncbi:MAG: single-stranded-DNA-specific exonuclease RecJ, partial [Acetobacter sp.]|nr:single-stranded-DNA-specific exonuclease RecJ [Acetobacter sp.]